MANIFQSKEVLKKTRNARGEAVIVPVYGMYVTGEYKPPYYNNNNGVFINSINTTKATVVDFTEDSVDVKDSFACGLASAAFNVDWNIQLYESETAPDQYTGFSCGICNASFDINFSIKEYERDYYDQPPTFSCGICTLGISVADSIIQVPTIIAEQTPESLLLLTSIQTTKATISDV
jgi:hypothetical protein